MSEQLTFSRLARLVWRDFLRARRSLFIYEILFKLLEAWLVVPAVTLILAIVMSQAGYVAVSNLDILEFVTTPFGLLYAGIFGTVVLGLLLLEQAGVMVLLALNDVAERPPITRLLRQMLGSVWRVTQLGAFLLVVFALMLLPLVLLALFAYRSLLSGHDIYYYLKVRPPVFWLAAGIGGVLLVAGIVVVALMYVRWSLALPILLFENERPRAALRASRDRVRGAGWRFGVILLGWLVGVFLLGVATEAGFRLFAAAVLDNLGERLLVLIALLLANGALLATVTFVLVVGCGLIARQLYLHQCEQLGITPRDEWGMLPGTPRPISPWNWRLAWLSLPLFLVAPLALWISLSRYQTDRPLVQVTAHRGHARAAPENTLSAMRKAIESGADYAEMDVQLTADGKIVLLHDRDLKRVAGLSKRLDELTYDEVRRLDVGSWFDPAFSGERVPTLAEVIDLCRGKIKLNIEMKFFGPDRQLAGKVADIIRERNFEADCLVTSLNNDGIQDAKRQNSGLRTGLIVAHALGDVSRLDVDVLSVRVDFLSAKLLRAAHHQGQEVHVWTVNDARQMFQAMKRGVDNIITSDPDLAIRVRDEWTNLPSSERLVLAARLLLGLEPGDSPADTP
jgi:glycerophosphoryl diester phosphodiesterase